MSNMDGLDLPDTDMADEDDFYLDDLGLKQKQTFTYLYDFGDSWEHKVQVVEIIALDENPDLPACIEGERAGALEDSGGIYGYENMLEVLKNPKHKEYQDTLDWAGDYDPEYFPLEDINRRFKMTFKPPKKPKAWGKK
jgi:hypothetical protein